MTLKPLTENDLLMPNNAIGARDILTDSLHAKDTRELLTLLLHQLVVRNTLMFFPLLEQVVQAKGPSLPMQPSA